MEEVQKAYFAGLMDGEGTVTFGKGHANEHRSPRISMSSTSYELLQALQDVAEGPICSMKETRENCKSAWHWSRSHNKALSFLEEILPYMKESSKVYRAKLLLAEYKTLLSPGHRRCTPELLAKRADFEQRFFHPSTT